MPFQETHQDCWSRAGIGRESCSRSGTGTGRAPGLSKLHRAPGPTQGFWTDTGLLDQHRGWPWEGLSKPHRGSWTGAGHKRRSQSGSGAGRAGAAAGSHRGLSQRFQGCPSTPGPALGLSDRTGTDRVRVSQTSTGTVGAHRDWPCPELPHRYRDSQTRTGTARVQGSQTGTGTGRVRDSQTRPRTAVSEALRRVPGLPDRYRDWPCPEHSDRYRDWPCPGLPDRYGDSQTRTGTGRVRGSQTGTGTLGPARVGPCAFPASARSIPASAGPGGPGAVPGARGGAGGGGRGGAVGAGGAGAGAEGGSAVGRAAAVARDERDGPGVRERRDSAAGRGSPAGQRPHVLGRAPGQPPGVRAAPARPPRSPAAPARAVPRPGAGPGGHRPAGHLLRQPLGAGFLPSQPHPDQPGPRRAHLPLLRLRHELLRPRHHAHPLHHGAGALPGPGAAVLLRALPEPPHGPGGPAGHLHLLGRLLLAAAAGLRALRAVLPRHLVLHPDAPGAAPQRRGGGGAERRLLGALRHAAPLPHPRRAAVQPERHRQPGPHAPPRAEEPQGGRPRAAPRGRRLRPAHVLHGRGDRPPPAALHHDHHLRHLLPALHDPCLREQAQRGRGRPRVGPAGPALPVHQLHRGSLGLCHPAAARAAPHALRALLPGDPHGPRQPRRVLCGDKAASTATPLRAVDPGGSCLLTGSSGPLSLGRMLRCWRASGGGSEDGEGLGTQAL